MSETKSNKTESEKRTLKPVRLKRLLGCPNCGEKPITEKDEVDVFLTFCSNFPDQNCDYIAPGFSEAQSKKEWNRYARQ